MVDAKKQKYFDKIEKQHAIKLSGVKGKVRGRGGVRQAKRGGQNGGVGQAEGVGHVGGVEH